MSDIAEKEKEKEEKELEELVLKESILNVSGLHSDRVQVGLRGDPSLRETTFSRHKYNSRTDTVCLTLLPNLQELLLNRGTYRLYIGFNNAEVRTYSIFDPLRMEIHDAERMAESPYINRHFPRIDYQEKIEVIREIYHSLENSRIYQRLPHYWARIIKARNQVWQPLKKEEIPRILSTLKLMRELEEYYLRNVSICMVQAMIRIQFNCDGTQLVDAENYKRFLEDNIL